MDAATLARQEGVSVEAMADRLRFQFAVDQLRESWPASILDESYAGGAMTHGAKPGAVLFFKGEVPPAVQSQVEREGIEGIQLIGGKQYSLTELQARQRAIHDAVVDLGFRSVYSSVDLTTQRIQLELSLDPGRPELQTAQQIRDAVVARFADARTAINVNVDDLDITTLPPGTAVVNPMHGYGGAGILRSNGQVVCTSAFSVRRNSDGLKGFVTAAHCEGITQMQQNLPSSPWVELVFSAPFVAEHIGTRGDIEWHYTSHDSFPEFWSSSTARRSVYGRMANSQIDINDSVCRYGRFGGYGCGTVSAVSSAATFNWADCSCTVTAYDMFDVNGSGGVPGDSGGPGFIVNTAFGIFHGERLSNGHRVFSKIQNAEIQFGVSVMLD